MPAPPSARSVFTSLRTADCKVIERTSEEGGWLRQLCPGVAGYGLELTEGDLRQNLLVDRPGGAKDNLSVPGLAGGGGFSALGPTAEWRGPPAEPFAPRTLTVRFNVQQAPPPAKDTSYLIVVRLAAPACAVAVMPPGPGQSDGARAIADGAELPACLPKPG